MRRLVYLSAGKRRGRKSAVARKKDSKALFEILSRTASSLSVPDWMKPKPAEAAGPSEETPPGKPEAEEQYLPAQTEPQAPPAEEEQTAEPVEEEIDVEVEVAAEMVETTEDEEPEEFAEEIDAAETEAVEAAEEEEPPPMLEEAAKTSRLRWLRRKRQSAAEETIPSASFSVNPRTVVILIVVAAVVFFLAAFLLGRITADRAGTAASGPSAPPTASAPLRVVVADDAPVACTSGRRDPDRFFLLIETLRGNGDAEKAEAERIIEFCKARGIPADMVELQRGNRTCVAVWGLLGFRFTNSTKALEHVRKVEDVGRAYFAKYKTYQFLQRRKKDGPLRPAFYSGKVEQTAG
ncbi:MAG: hypothetical protein JW849_04245 [Phycisphaerae bacterium]|nr:hypothetical protein [Phycisphaerae bacterium]